MRFSFRRQQQESNFSHRNLKGIYLKSKGSPPERTLEMSVKVPASAPVTVVGVSEKPSVASEGGRVVVSIAVVALSSGC